MKKTGLYPLKFEPIYQEKVWGGRKLLDLGKELPGNDRDTIGESWELADLAQTSFSGAGGGAARSIVSNGPLKGMRLHDIIELYGKDLMGNMPLSPQGGFPLLVKFLDAEENLSVQVHPNKAYADTHDNAFIKSECWYVMCANEGAVIYRGVKEGVTEKQFRKAIANHTVRDLLIEVPVKAGDCYYVPSGTCHALGEGIAVAEVQTPSDTTFRVYDWNRTGRELHIDQAMQCIKMGPPDVSRTEINTVIQGEYARITHLMECLHFRIDRIQVRKGFKCNINWHQPVIWMMLDGKGHFSSEDAPHTSYKRGQTILLPAKMAQCKFTAEEDTTYLEVSFPQVDDTRLAKKLTDD